MKWETTTILLEQLQNSDNDAWQRFTTRFREPMLHFAGRMGLSDAQAEDAVQDALVQFLEGYREGKYDRSKGRLGSWLFALMYQSIRSHRRDGYRSPMQAPTPTHRTTFFSALPDENTARAEWEMDWDRHSINRCMSQLRGEVNPTHYRAFELMTIRQVPAMEVAEQLGLSRDAVYQARYRVLKRLEELRGEFDGIEEIAS
jgi:RNA polymerase sigma factor (sigma-70 family)